MTAPKLTESQREALEVISRLNELNYIPRAISVRVIRNLRAKGYVAGVRITDAGRAALRGES